MRSGVYGTVQAWMWAGFTKQFSVKVDDGIRESWVYEVDGDGKADPGRVCRNELHDLIELVSLSPAKVDAEALAVETLNGLGFRFDGQCWVQDAVADSPSGHPLHAVFMDAIEQAMYGKGKRHGGAVAPFTEQPWAHYARLHGRGFLTGQSAKKLEEAASLRQGDAFITEVLGAIVYAGMAVLKERGEV
jgi:hypothetical protein